MDPTVRSPMAGEHQLCRARPGRAMVGLVSGSTLGSRLRQLREALELTQDEVSMRSVDQDGRILRRIEVGHVESGRNMASTLRVRTSLARAFGATEAELFDYLDGRVSLADFLKERARPSRTAAGIDDAKSQREQAIELVIADGYGTAIEVRKAASIARDGLPPAKADALGILEWANLIEATLRQMRRARDPAASSGISAKAGARGIGLVPKTRGKRTG
jgi:transcriptional regulator with XRE-family HTH domain